MKNQNGKPGTSTFYHLALFYAIPHKLKSKWIEKFYCQNGDEEFPSWNRPYMYFFEKALQDADRRNGNDGLISLPYWDWENAPQEDPIPQFVRKDLFLRIKDLVREEDLEHFSGDIERPTSEDIFAQIQESNLKQRTLNTLRSK